MSNDRVTYSGRNVIIKDGEEIAPGIFVYDEVIDNSQELIDFSLLNTDGWQEAKVGYGDGNIDMSIRHTRMLGIPPIFSNDIKYFEVAQVVWAYANQYAINHDISFSEMEHPQLLHYSVNGSFYKAHVDSGPGMHRIFSAVLYLNDVENGGETFFNKLNVSVSPKAGRLIIFPADYVYIHEARVPISEDKFVIVTWFKP